MTSKKIATYFVLVSVGFAMGLGAVAVAERQSNQVQISARSDSRTVRELRAINSEMKKLNKSVGRWSIDGSMIGILYEICKDTPRTSLSSCSATSY